MMYIFLPDIIFRIDFHIFDREAQAWVSRKMFEWLNICGANEADFFKFWIDYQYSRTFSCKKNLTVRK